MPGERSGERAAILNERLPMWTRMLAHPIVNTQTKQADDARDDE
jgi:hypothetical protein